jgi:hypothetical protein
MEPGDDVRVTEPARPASDGRPWLVDFALDECRQQAEVLVSGE